MSMKGFLSALVMIAVIAMMIKNCTTQSVTVRNIQRRNEVLEEVMR